MKEPRQMTKWVGLPAMESPKLVKTDPLIELKEVLSDIGSHVLDSKYTLKN